MRPDTRPDRPPNEGATDRPHADAPRARTPAPGHPPPVECSSSGPPSQAVGGACDSSSDRCRQPVREMLRDQHRARIPPGRAAEPAELDADLEAGRGRPGAGAARAGARRAAHRRRRRPGRRAGPQQPAGGDPGPGGGGRRTRCARSATRPRSTWPATAPGTAACWTSATARPTARSTRWLNALRGTGELDPATAVRAAAGRGGVGQLSELRADVTGNPAIPSTRSVAATATSSAASTCSTAPCCASCARRPPPAWPTP